MMQIKALQQTFPNLTYLLIAGFGSQVSLVIQMIYLTAIFLVFVTETGPRLIQSTMCNVHVSPAYIYFQ